MKIYEEEVEFKKDLDKIGIRYGDLNNTWKFYVEFIDNKGASLMTYAIAKTPVSALRSIPSLLEKYKLPAEDLDVVVRFAFSVDEDSYNYVTINSIISPYMYFKKEVQVGSVSPDNKSE